MYTDIRFVNQSLNWHCRNVAVYFRTDPLSGSPDLAWTCIHNCRYDWWRPFRIAWAFDCRLYDLYGNYSPPIALRPGLSARPLQRFGIGLTWSAEACAPTVTFQRRGNNEAAGIALENQGRLLAQKPFGSGRILQFHLPDRFFICADVRTSEGRHIAPGEINVSETQFDFRGWRSFSIFMQGGGPGPFSKQIQFQRGKCRKF